MKSPSLRKARPTRRDRRVEVLEEAAKALNARGVSQAALTEIARGLGVSRPALYYYFEDQEDLVFQSYVRSCEILSRQFSNAVKAGGDAMDVIEAFIGGMLDEDANEAAALCEVAYLRPEQREIVRGFYGAILSDIADLLTLGAGRGELRECSTRIVGHAIIGLVSTIALAKRRWWANVPVSGQVSYRDLVAALKSMLTVGVAADRGAPVSYKPFDLPSRHLPVGGVFDTEALAAAKLEALLAAASWLFNLKGVDATSLDEIALKVGVTKRVIYHNIGDKEALVAACYRRTFKFYKDIAERTKAYDGSRIEALCASWHAHADASLREDMAPLGPLMGYQALSAKDLKSIQDEGSQRANYYLQFYAEGQAEGSIRPLNARALLSIQLRMFRWLPKWIDPVDEAERQSVAREITDLICLGLRPA